MTVCAPGHEPLVSVVMSVYNGGSELEESLVSVLNQKDCNFEFIVVDDGSTDSSLRLLERTARDDSRLKVIHQTNRGLTHALIKGCGLARAPFVARQDCGDVSHEYRLFKMASRLQARDDLSFVAGAYRHTGPKGELLERVGPRESDERFREVLLAGDPTTLYGPHHGTVMFRKQAYQQVGGYREEFYFAQDLDLWTRLATVGEVEYLSEELYESRFSYDSISARQTARQAALRELIAEASRLRAVGASENEVLERAAHIRPSESVPSTQSDADIDYFLGSCLASRGDPAAKAYFLRALKKRPFSPKAWAKLVRASLPGFGV
jgi:glycosyltransferase involved in cell wall biosynthesis